MLSLFKGSDGVSTDEMSREKPYKFAERFQKQFKSVPIDFKDCIEYFSDAEEILEALESQLPTEDVSMDYLQM